MDTPTAPLTVGSVIGDMHCSSLAALKAGRPGFGQEAFLARFEVLDATEFDAARFGDWIDQHLKSAGSSRRYCNKDLVVIGEEANGTFAVAYSYDDTRAGIGTVRLRA